MTSAANPRRSRAVTPTVQPHPLLVEDATDCLGFERLGGFSARAARMATRDMLADRARALGIADWKIEAAIDAALEAASSSADRT